jgi:hypothetical protein
MHQPSAAILWALIPLTILGSLPRIGCICANGRQKLFCGGMADPCCVQHRNPVRPPGQRACCRTLSSAAPASQNATKVGACPHCRRNDSRSSSPSFAPRCCVPVVGVPLLPPVLKSGLPTNAPVPPLWIDGPNSAGTSVVASGDQATRNLNLPIPDLLIAHQLLLI